VAIKRLPNNLANRVDNLGKSRIPAGCLSASKQIVPQNDTIRNDKMGELRWQFGISDEGAIKRPLN